jgi:hypothetical protein
MTTVSPNATIPGMTTVSPNATTPGINNTTTYPTTKNPTKFTDIKNYANTNINTNQNSDPTAATTTDYVVTGTTAVVGAALAVKLISLALVA